MTEIEIIERLVGKPYGEGGRDPNTGMDCRGVVEFWMRERGTPIPGLESVDPLDLEGAAAWKCFETITGTIRNGDVLAWEHDGAANHLAIYHDARLLHAVKTMGKIVYTPARAAVMNNVRILRRLPC